MEDRSREWKAEDWDDLIEVRVDELEHLYESANVTDMDRATLEQIHRKLALLLGGANAELLHTYTDRLIAVYNRDGDWFYRKGWADAMQTMNDIPAPNSQLGK